MRSILITNDDGIGADGICRLAAAAKEFGEVWVVAPESQRSAMSHCITLHKPIDVFPRDFPVEGVNAFSCSGTPADCVRVGSLSVMPHRPDVLLSGINCGYNVATDIQYSATAGAAFEGAFQGYLSIAFSEAGGADHSVTDKYLREILAELLEKEPPDNAIWNVNFPQCRLAECRGILRERTVSRGLIFCDSYDTVEELPGGGRRLMVNGRFDPYAEPGSDLRAVLENYISIGIAKNIG